MSQVTYINKTNVSGLMVTVSTTEKSTFEFCPETGACTYRRAY